MDPAEANIQYGIFPINQTNNIDELADKKQHGSTCLLHDEDKYYCCINILGNWFYRISKQPYEIYEYNPNVDVVCKKWCRGTYIETEYKINVLSCHIEFFSLFDNINFAHFSKGVSSVMPSFEEYFYYILEKRNSIITPYYVIIHESKTSGPNAIKFKTISRGEILTRKVSLIDYTQENLNYTKNTLLSGASKILEGPIKLPTFNKTKKRFPVLDEENGLIYGVSYSISQLTTWPFKKFCQIEIEYWSQLIPKGVNNGQAASCKQRNISYQKLIKSIIQELTKNDISFDEKQTTKLEWLQRHAEH